MNIKILKSEKNEIELELDNLTIVEILRAYLVKDDDVDFAAWKRMHPDKNPVLVVKTKTKPAKKVLQGAISKIGKDADSLVEQLKKAK